MNPSENNESRNKCLVCFLRLNVTLYLEIALGAAYQNGVNMEYA